MAKYFITFVLLAFLALENNNIYNRLHAKSQPSPDDTNAVTHFMRQNQYRHHTQPLTNHHPTHDHHQTHHARKHVKQHQRHNADNGEADDNAKRDVERVKRHMEQQRQHRQEHEKRLHQRPHQQRPIYSEETLKTLPRIWQHLSMMADDYEENDNADGERMFGDGPAKASSEYDYQSPEIPVSLSEEDEEEVALPPSRKHESEVSEENTHSNGDHKTGGVPCPKCESSRKVENVSEEELTRLRIEFVKQQILEKLRLTERPKIAAVRLPKPISEGVTIEEEEDDDSSKKDLDDYYARTSKKFIFLEVEKEQCRKLGSKPSMCFSFKLDDADSDGYEVRAAVLWIFKNGQQKFGKSNHTAANHQTIVVSEVQQEINSNDVPTVKTIAEQSVDVQDEWMKIDIEWPIKRWFGNHELSHLIQISCESCDMKAMEHMISTDKDYRPFIMVDTQSRRRQPRQKRNINCTGGVTECCREKLYISFEDIGWGDWIIQPRGYDAYFCRGSCKSVASVASASSQHSSVLQKLLNIPGQRSKRPELIPCCTAKQYSSLQLVFTERDNTATQKTFPNMVVESCGCR